MLIATFLHYRPTMASEKNKTLYVGGLPYSTTNEGLEQVFSTIGPLKSCFIVTDSGILAYNYVTGSVHI